MTKEMIDFGECRECSLKTMTRKWWVELEQTYDVTYSYLPDVYLVTDCPKCGRELRFNPPWTWIIERAFSMGG